MDESPYCWAAWSMLVLVVVVCVQGGGCPLSGARRRVGQLPPSLRRTTISTPTLCISTWGHGHIIGAVLQIILKLSLKYPISSKTKAFELPSSLQQIQSIHGRIIPSSIWCDAEMHNYICH